MKKEFTQEQKDQAKRELEHYRKTGEPLGWTDDADYDLPISEGYPKEKSRKSDVKGKK